MRPLLAAALLLCLLPPGAAADAVPPVGTRLTELQVKRPSQGALRVSYRLDEADRVRFDLMALRRSRWVTLRSFSRPGEQGPNAFRMRARGLRLGRYMLKATPRAGSAVFRRFRVKSVPSVGATTFD